MLYLIKLEELTIQRAKDESCVTKGAATTHLTDFVTYRQTTEPKKNRSAKY